MLFLPQSMTYFVLKTEIKSNLITLTVYCPLHIKFKEIYAYNKNNDTNKKMLI